MPEYIVNGTLIEGSGRASELLRFRVLSAGRIDEVCTDPAKPLPRDANILLDAKGMTVMPGLVDAHCHLSYGAARNIEEQDLYGSAEYRAIRGTWHAGKVLRAGVTSVSDPGGSWMVAVAVRDAINAGMFPGPRIAAAGRYLTSHTGLADYFPAWVGNVPSGVGALTLIANLAEWGHLCGCSQPRVDRARRTLDMASEILCYAHTQGATLMCGTDSGFSLTPFGEWHAREMQLFVERIGMTPLEAITCGTRNAAFAVDAASVGTLEPGKWADVLAIKGDPLQDIRVLQDKSAIAAVFKAGQPGHP